MKKQTVLIIVLLGLTAWLGYDKITGKTTDLSPYVKQIAEMSEVVAELTQGCRK